MDFPTEEQHDRYIDGLLTEQSEAQSRLDAAKSAGADTKQIQEHLKSLDVELDRVGYEPDEDDDDDADETPKRASRSRGAGKSTRLRGAGKSMRAAATPAADATPASSDDGSTGNDAS